MIPNNIHFIFYGFTEFAMIHYLAVKSAYMVHKPDKIFMHYNTEPVNNPLWEDMKQYVELRHIVPPTHFHGIELTSYQYKADINRLEILIREGGIYLDIDVLSNKPFGELLNNKCVLGIEAHDDPDSLDLYAARSVTNAVIMTEPNHPFMIDWLERTKDYIIGQSWAYHAVCLPLLMLKEKQYDVHLEPRKSFMPFDFRDDYIFQVDFEKYLWLKENAYTMHFWETIWYDRYLRHVNDNYLYRVNNNFTRFFKQYR